MKTGFEGVFNGLAAENVSVFSTVTQQDLYKEMVLEEGKVKYTSGVNC